MKRCWRARCRARDKCQPMTSRVLSGNLLLRLADRSSRDLSKAFSAGAINQWVWRHDPRTLEARCPSSECHCLSRRFSQPSRWPQLLSLCRSHGAPHDGCQDCARQGGTCAVWRHGGAAHRENPLPLAMLPEGNLYWDRALARHPVRRCGSAGNRQSTYSVERDAGATVVQS